MIRSHCQNQFLRAEDAATVTESKLLIHKTNMVKSKLTVYTAKNESHRSLIAQQNCWYARAQKTLKVQL